MNAALTPFNIITNPIANSLYHFINIIDWYKIDKGQQCRMLIHICTFFRYKNFILGQTLVYSGCFQ
ncbi:hypothetical protein AAW02_13660 [Aeromonas dhakensis]|nr:hypothetical protein AAW03_12385 [Aeromonas dhakensis]PHS86941.1 hypothetical protein AAW02_13660 [Aeromonas dhakensis]